MEEIMARVMSFGILGVKGYPVTVFPGWKSSDFLIRLCVKAKTALTLQSSIQDGKCSQGE